jgi:hypothetical protein
MHISIRRCRERTLSPAFVKGFVDHAALSGKTLKTIRMDGMNRLRVRIPASAQDERAAAANND